MDLEKVVADFEAIAERQNWRRHHTPKNLAAAVAVEAGELLEYFQWLPESNVEQLSSLRSDRSAIAEEIADVFVYLLMLSRKLDIPFERAVQDKMEKNRQRFNASMLENNNARG